MTITEFLLARIAEDEAAALGAQSASPWTSRGGDVYHIEGGTWWIVVDGAGQPDADHIARHDPASILAECAAKRRIVELHNGEHECVGDRHGHRTCVLVAAGYEYEIDPTLRILAMLYADHPDFRAEWRQDT